MAFFQLSKQQQHIYDKAATGIAYTVHQLAKMAGPFTADADLKTPGMLDQLDDLFMDAIEGLTKAGYFTPAVDPYGSALDLGDWTFTKVADHVNTVVPVPEPAWQIPWTVQGYLIPGIAP